MSFPGRNGRARVESSEGLPRIPEGGWPNCGATSQHTAHHLRSARIHYRHHPFFDHGVEVVRTIRLHEDPSVIIRLEDGLQISIPCWMLDPVCCVAIRDEARPRISVEALFALRNLIDAQSCFGGPDTDSSGRSRHEGESDAPEPVRSPPPTTPAKNRFRRKKSLAEISGVMSAGVPEADHAASGRGDS